MAVFLTEFVAQLDQSGNLTPAVPIGYALHTRGCDISPKSRACPKHAILGALKPADFNICRRAIRAVCTITPPANANAPATLPPALLAHTNASFTTNPIELLRTLRQAQAAHKANANLYGLNTKENKSYFKLNHHTIKNNVAGFFVPLHRKNKVIRLIILIIR